MCFSMYTRIHVCFCFRKYISIRPLSESETAICYPSGASSPTTATDDFPGQALTSSLESRKGFFYSGSLWLYCGVIKVLQ